MIASLLVICAMILACNLPGGAATEGPAGDASPTFTQIVLDPGSPSPTVAATVTACSPIITTTTDANVRGGPGQVYDIYGVIPQGGTAPVDGKSFDGAWWHILFSGGPGGFGWISASITVATCIPATLAVIAAPPTPTLPPTATSTLTPTATATYTPTFTPSPTPTPTLFIPPFPTIDIPCIFC